MLNYTGPATENDRVFRNGLALLLFTEVVVSSLGIAQLLPSIGYRRPLDWLFLMARAVITALELIAAASLSNAREARLLLAGRVLLGSAGLLTLELGFRLAPSNLDPTFRWWIVGGYWAYALVVQWGARRITRRPQGSFFEGLLEK